MDKVSFRIPEEGKQQLRRYAREHHRTLTNTIRHLLIRGLDQEGEEVDETMLYPGG